MDMEEFRGITVSVIHNPMGIPYHIIEYDRYRPKFFDFDSKYVFINPQYAEYMSREDVINFLYHNIAHYKTSKRHDEDFKAKAIKLGCQESYLYYHIIIVDNKLKGIRHIMKTTKEDILWVLNTLGKNDGKFTLPLKQSRQVFNTYPDDLEYNDFIVYSQRHLALNDIKEFKIQATTEDRVIFTR